MNFFACLAALLFSLSFSDGAAIPDNVLLRKRAVGEVRPPPSGGFGSTQTFYSKASYRSPGGYGGGISYPGAYVGGQTLGLGGRPGSGYGFGYPSKHHHQPGISGISGSSSSSNSASQSVSQGGGGYPGLGGRPGGFGGRPGGYGGGLSGSASNSGSQSFNNGGLSGSSSSSSSQSFVSGSGGLSGSSSQSSSSSNSNSFGNGRFGGSGSSSQSSSSSNSFSGK